ncbi:MAG: hypothetical protein ACI8W0_000005 [Flavobacterium sp.]|jgi:hypothetical protein
MARAPESSGFQTYLLILDENRGVPAFNQYLLTRLRILIYKTTICWEITKRQSC